MKHTDRSPQAQEREELERQVEILRHEVRQLRLEQELLNKANELLKNVRCQVLVASSVGSKSLYATIG